MPGVAAIEIAAPPAVSDDLARALVNLPAVDAGLDELLGFLQGKVCRAIDSALLLGGITADHGASEIAGVAFDYRADVEDHHFAGLDDLLGSDPLEHRCVVAGRDEWDERLEIRAGAPHGADCFGGDEVLAARK